MTATFDGTGVEHILGSAQLATELLNNVRTPLTLGCEESAFEIALAAVLHRLQHDEYGWRSEMSAPRREAIERHPEWLASAVADEVTQ